MKFTTQCCAQVWDAGQVLLIANAPGELNHAWAAAKRHCNSLGDDVSFTGPGFHNEQLTPEEYFAWRRVEVASRLEQMARARGQPRPGAVHPEALADDTDGIQGGERPDDEAAFETEGALPGGSE